MLMATPDVSVHVEEVVVVTTPDNAADGSGMEEVKTVLVTTSLGQHRSLSEETIETENVAAAAAAAAFTESSELKETVLVKMAEEENVETEIIYPITCGENKANLIWRKFVCPGINVKCVQYDEHLISPKEFVHLAGKSTLKDWKRAIRMNGVMLRKIMDSGELDFYHHTKVCSNTCRSTKIDPSGARVSLSSQSSTEYIPITPASTDMNGSPATITIETCEDSSDWSLSIAELRCEELQKCYCILRTLESSRLTAPRMCECLPARHETFGFWQGLNDAGLLDEVIQEFQQELLETMKGLQQRLQDTPLQLQDAILLNNTVQSFGMLDLVKKILASHKSQMDRSREQQARDLAALEQQCDEHRKRAKELKHKSQHLNNVLMTLTPVTIPSPVKRPRLARATSGPAAISTSTQGVPVSQIISLPSRKMVSTLPGTLVNKGSSQASSPFLGGYTVLASQGSSFPSALEIHPDSSNLTVLSTAAIQDGSTLVKVLSPFQLLTLPGLGNTLQNVAQMAPTGSTIVAVAASVAEENSTTTTIEVSTLTEEQEQK
uniref:Glucocorticoid modulatory element-binding protein 2 isoform X2 n=1 Tax=Geotrypetes seraphini TaxID=260995 RepID=A0A6P8SK63_GEOSA|nr:glucocorticoid modulatory element-binding protein 2 isoform X2 [Geotrypetes seraphini]